MRVYLIVLLYIAISCTQELELEIASEKQRIVVDGWIEQGEYPVVVLTRSTAYFSVVDSSSFLNFIVTNAKVTVSNGIQTEVLTLRRDNKKFPPFYYQGTEIIGEVGKSYWLEVKYYDTLLTAVTFIQALPVIDTVWFEYKEGSDTLGYYRLQFTDRADEKNYYRVLYKIEGQMNDFVPAYISALDDSYINGTTNYFPVYKGSTNPLDKQNSLYFKKSEKVIIKFCSVDEISYLFWRGYQLEMMNSINPFASVSYNMKSNIEGFGFGIWSGAAVKYYTITP